MSVDDYALLCSAPCTAELKKGRYRFSLARDGQTVSTAADVAVSPGDTIVGQYESFSGRRWAGFAVMVVGSAVGLTYALTGTSEHTETCNINSSYSDFSACVMRDQNSDDDHTAQRHALTGGGIALASLVIGGILALKQDEATVQVLPGVAPPGSGVSDRRGLGFYAPQGVTISARF